MLRSGSTGGQEQGSEGAWPASSPMASSIGRWIDVSSPFANEQLFRMLTNITATAAPTNNLNPRDPLGISLTLVHGNSSTVLATATTATATTTTTTSTTTSPTSVSSECSQQQNHSPLSFDCINHFININHDELNFSDLEEVWLVKSWQAILLRVAFVVPIVLLGILGNLTIIYSMCKFKRFRSKPTNIFLLNMALADLLTTIFCPTAALFTDIYQFYVLGAFICRFEGFIKITCLLVSAYSLIILSTDWLLCVVQPCRTRISIKKSWLALISIWLISILMASPLFVWRRLRERQWRDLLEVWCCELIQYTKFYWAGITFFLIYLPTLFMTIVLVVILAQMDEFEAKLKRSRNAQFNSCSSNGTLSINIKYRRRIVKILFTYLMTSMICWTPLQFTIIYRHFRSEAVPAPWFFELVFFSQLSASLSATMNPIIFGFLSQPFRQVLRKSLMFRFVDKLWTTNNVKNTDQRDNHHHHHHQHHNNNNNNLYPMNRRHVNNNSNSTKSNRQSGLQKATRELSPRLTLEYVDPANQINAQASSQQPRRQPTAGSRSSAVGSSHQARQQQLQQQSSGSQNPTRSTILIGSNDFRLPDNAGGGHSKRVSFNTTTTTAAASKKPPQHPQDSRVGHENAAFEHDRASKGPIANGPVRESHHPNKPEIGTTSFISNTKRSDG